MLTYAAAAIPARLMQLATMTPPMSTHWATFEATPADLVTRSGSLLWRNSPTRTMPRAIRGLAMNAPANAAYATTGPNGMHANAGTDASMTAGTFLSLQNFRIRAAASDMIPSSCAGIERTSALRGCATRAASLACGKLRLSDTIVATGQFTSGAGQWIMFSHSRA